MSSIKIKLTAIGYWKSCYEPDLPDPTNFINSNWDLNEKKQVMEHLVKSSIIAEWMGISWCRFRCGEMGLGAKCLTDGIYIYPEGLLHYIDKHAIKLPQKFINHVLSYNTKYESIDYKNIEIDYDWWKNEKGTDFNTSLKSFLTSTDEEIRKYEKRTKAIDFLLGRQI